MSPLDQFRKQMMCSAGAAFFAGCLSAAPSIYSMLVFERALPSQTISSLAVLGLALLLVMISQVAISWAGQEYANASWRMMAPTVKGHPLLVQRVDHAFSSGLVWAALSLTPAPVLLGGCLYLHPIIFCATIATLAFYWIAHKLHWHLFPRIVSATLSPAILTLAIGLSIVGSLSPGAAVAASFLVVAICSPAREVIRHWGSITQALDAYKALRRSAAFASATIDPAMQAHALGFGRMVIGGNGFVVVILLLASVIPAPSVIILPGRASPLASISGIKAPATTKVEKVFVRDGDAVEVGHPIISLASDELRDQVKSVQGQIDLDEESIDTAQNAQIRRSELLKSQAAHIEGLVKQKLRPESDLTSLRLAHMSEIDAMTRALYERRSNLLKLKERQSELARVIGSLTILAPVSGRVQQLASLAPGTPVTAGDLLLTLVADAQATIEATLKPQDRPRIGEGQKAQIRVKTSESRYGPSISAIVHAISPDRYPDNAYRVFLDMPSPLPTGTEVEVTIVHGENQTAAQWVGDVVSGALRGTIR